MKRISFILLLAAITANTIVAQKNRINDNPASDYAKGRELFDQRHHAASTKWFEKFLDDHDCADCDDLRSDARYYIAANAYYLKDSEAADLLEQYLATYPNSTHYSRACFMLGRIHFEKKAYAEALKYFDRINSNSLTDNETDEYLYAKGHSHLVMKDYRRASAVFSALATPGKRYSSEARYYYGYSEFCQKHYEEAAEIFASISEKSEYYESGQYFTLQIYDQLHLRQQAVELGKSLISKYPSSKYNSEAYRILGENSYFQGSWDDAARFLQLYVKNQSKTQRSALYMLGISLYKSEAYDNAANTLGKVTTEKDTMAQNAYLFIGHSYLKQNKADKARMAFQSASLIEADRKLQEEALYNYAVATLESKAPFGEMIKAFEKFITEYPQSSHRDNIYEHMADIYLTDKDYRNALTSISNIKNLTPKLRQAKEQALFHLGVEAHRAGSYQNAVDLFSQSIAENSSSSFSAQAYLWRGEAYYQLGNLSAARDNINLFLGKKQGKTADQLIKAYYTLGYTYFEVKQYSLAKPYFNRFMEVQGAEKSRYYSDVVNRLADCYFYNRDFDGAASMYSRVPANSPLADYAMYQKAFILGLQKKYDDKIAELRTLTSKYPHSDYHDDAMYEIGRTYVLREQYSAAIAAYKALQTSHPQSQLSRKATLEIGMLYANMGNTDEALASYKSVVERYPTSEETRVALESMQSIYIDLNQVDDYLAYRESIAGTTISTVAKSQEDSISFLAAEQVFAKGEYASAITTLNNYLARYCEQPTLNCIAAQYYLAESYYQTGDRQRALNHYDKLASMDGNIYMEPSLVRASEIAYDMKNYASANEYFSQLRVAASNKDNRSIARLGVLRCSYFTNQFESTIEMATEIIIDPNSEPEVISEARFCRAKALVLSNRASEANADLIALGTDISYATGAEAKYQYAQNLSDNGDADAAEKVILEFIEMGTPHQYWLARCFVLLSDIYKSRGDYFMAKQYLLSLQENYTEPNDIQQMISERMGLLQELETENVLQ